jgi:hypothetical protein
MTNSLRVVALGALCHIASLQAQKVQCFLVENPSHANNSRTPRRACSTSSMVL